LIANGHSHAYEYRTSFFNTALDEVNKEALRNLKDGAIASSVGATGSLHDFIDEVNKLIDPPKPSNPNDIMLQLDKPIE
jgi:hypothetical protein